MVKTTLNFNIWRNKIEKEKGEFRSFDPITNGHVDIIKKKL